MRVPVYIVSGFLGSGKTTLINRLRAVPALSGTLVIVNEIGDVGIDGALFQDGQGEARVLADGCVCCSLESELTRMLQELARQRARGEVAFKRIVIETTGVADPCPIVRRLQRNPVMKANFQLCGVLTVIDAARIAEQLLHGVEAAHQILAADQVVLSRLLDKQTRGGSSLADELEEMIGRINPHCQVRSSDDLEHWQAYFRQDNRTPFADEPWHMPPQETSAEEAESRGHMRAYNSFSLDVSALDNEVAINSFVRALQDSFGEHMLRIKGLVRVRGREQTPLLINITSGFVYDFQWLPQWPVQIDQPRLVCITREVEQKEVEELLQITLRMSARARPDTSAPD